MTGNCSFVIGFLLEWGAFLANYEEHRPTLPLLPRQEAKQKCGGLAGLRPMEGATVLITKKTKGIIGSD